MTVYILKYVCTVSEGAHISGDKRKKSRTQCTCYTWPVIFAFLIINFIIYFKINIRFRLCKDQNNVNNREYESQHFPTSIYPSHKFTKLILFCPKIKKIIGTIWLSLQFCFFTIVVVDYSAIIRCSMILCMLITKKITFLWKIHYNCILFRKESSCISIKIIYICNLDNHRYIF